MAEFTCWLRNAYCMTGCHFQLASHTITQHQSSCTLLISAQLSLLLHMTVIHAGLHSHFRQSSRDGQHAASCPGSSEHGY